MKKIICVCLLLFTARYVSAQSVSWMWAHNAGSQAMNETVSLSKDHLGNTYAIGYFSGTSIQLGSFNLINAGGSDVLLIKYDPLGNIVWATTAGKAGEDFGNDVHCDVFGNIWITGSFESSTIQFGTYMLTNSGESDFFIARYNSQGIPVWAASAIGGDWDYGMDLTSDNMGNVYVSGIYAGTIDFGTGQLTTTGDNDIFLVKYVASGGIAWVKNFGSIYSDEMYDMEMAPDGFIYMTGYFYTSPIIFDQDTLISAGGHDAFLAKADSSGDIIWAKSFGGTNDDFSLSISTAAPGLIYLGGNYRSDPMLFDTNSMLNSGFEDLFIIQCDTSGNLIWSKTAGGMYYETIWSLAAETNGNVYATGFFSGFSLTLDSITMNISFPPLNSDVFVAGFDVGGNVLWATSLEGSSEDYGYDIITHGNGMICMTGNFLSPSLTVGPYVLPISTLSPGDLFVAAISLTTGLPENSPGHAAGILFPNPVSDVATLMLPNNDPIKALLVFDMQGRIILEVINPSKHELQIDCTLFENGMYTVQWIKKNGESERAKLMVSH